MTANWAACLLAACIGVDGPSGRSPASHDPSRDGDARLAPPNPQRNDGPVWVPKIFRADWWKRRQADSNVKPRTDEAAQRRPALSLPSRRRTERPSANLIISRCRAALHQEAELKDSTIYVDVEDDVLTLSGTVPSVLERDRAERIARKTEGVAEVRNHLVISNSITDWFKQSAVTLSTPPKPQETQTLRPSNPQMAKQTVEPPTSIAKGLLPPTDDLKSPLPAGDRYAKVIPAPPGAGSANGLPAHPAGVKPSVVGRRPPLATLGRPEEIRLRPDLPVVVTYVVTVPPAKNQQDLASAARIPVTVKDEPKVTVIGDFQPPKAVEKPPALLPRMDAAPVKIGLPQPIRPQTAPLSTPTMPIQSISRKPAEAADFSTTLGSQIAALLKHETRAQRLGFELSGSEVFLSGAIATPSDLYEVAAKLRNLRGVEIVSFGQIRFGY